MKNLLFLMVLAAIALTSCNPPSRPSELEHFSYIFKKVDGKTLWGVRYEFDGRTYIEPQYDTIWVDEFYKEFVGRKDNHNDLYFLDKIIVKNFLSSEYVTSEGLDGDVFGETSTYHRIYTEAGVIGYVDNGLPRAQRYYGPYKEFYPGLYGYIFQENGSEKYGYQREYLLQKTSQYTDGDYMPKLLLKCEYDKVFEITTLTNQHGYQIYLLAFKGQKIEVYNLKGELLKKNPSWLLSIVKRAKKVPMVKTGVVTRSYQQSGTDDAKIVFYQE